MSQDNLVQVTEKMPVYARPARAARHFEIGKATLWQWVKTRHDFPKPLKAGPRVTLFDIAAIERYLHSQAQK